MSAAPEEISDDVLVARATRGDRAAFETIYRRHVARVFRLTSRLLRDATDAEDATQTTFEIVLDRLGTLRDPGALRGWIVQIAVREVRQRLRRARLLRTLGLSWPRALEPERQVALESCAAGGVTPEQRAELALLDHSLGQLDVADRLAWMLRHVEGLPLEEVAQGCDCSLATAKRRIQRADAHVRARVALAEREGADD